MQAADRSDTSCPGQIDLHNRTTIQNRSELRLTETSCERSAMVADRRCVDHSDTVNRSIVNDQAKDPLLLPDSRQ